MENKKLERWAQNLLDTCKRNNLKRICFIYGREKVTSVVKDQFDEALALLEDAMVDGESVSIRQ